MAGLKCTTSKCGFSTEVPGKDVAQLRLPSAEITCPKCRRTQPAADAWVAYEAMMEQLSKGPFKAFSFPILTAPASKSRLVV